MIKYETNTISGTTEHIYLTTEAAKWQGYRYDVDNITYYIAKDNLLLFLMHSYAHLIDKKINDFDEYTVAESYDINPTELLENLETNNGIDLIENYLNNYLNENQIEHEYQYEY